MARYQDAYQDSLVREEIRQYNKMVLKCYKECVTDFQSSDLRNDERKCGENCSSRFLGSLDVVSNTFNKILNNPSA